MRTVVPSVTIFVVFVCLNLAFATPDSSEVKDDEQIATYSGTRQSRAEIPGLYPFPRIGRRSPLPTTMWAQGSIYRSSLCEALPDMETLCWDPKRLIAFPRTGRSSNIQM